MATAVASFAKQWVSGVLNDTGVQAALYEYGKDAARKVLPGPKAIASGSAAVVPPGSVGAELLEVVKPAISPLVAGFTDEAKIYVTKVVTVGGIGLAVALALAFFAGRATAR